MYKILHLFDPNRGSRYPQMISQGLMAHPEVDAYLEAPYTSLGLTIPPRRISSDEVDYIFRAGTDHYSCPYDLDPAKVIYYDFSDDPAVNQVALDQARLYVKRTYNGQPGVLHVPYGVLDEYLHLNELPFRRDIEVAYLFDINRLYGNTKARAQVGRALKEFALELGLHKWVIGRETTTVGRRLIFDPPGGNMFVEYLRLLKRSKIVFTALPDHPGGDSRFWEALASGALVFADGQPQDMPWPLEDGKHCFLFDSSSKSGIDRVIWQAYDMLKKPEKLAEIAQAGQAYVLEHHRSVNRVETILEALIDGNG